MKNDYIVKKLYISFVVVSILSALTATAGMLIDNIVVGAFLGDDALGAMGIVGPISLIFSAFGNICSGGGTARAAQALGKGEIDKVRQIFTVTMIFVIVSGLLLTLVGVFFTPQIATFLGAKGELLEPTVDYLRGFFLGAIPTIMLTALAGFVKIDGSPRLPLVSIVVMSVANIILDLMMVMVFDAGMYGMALATTISYVLAVLTSCTHFLKKTSTLGLAKPIKGGKEMMSMVTTGAPTAISRICDTIKVMVLNNILVLFVSVGAVTALNVRTQANNFFGAFIMGLAQASVPLLGMFYGEEDKTAIKDTLKNTLRIGIIMNGLIGVVLFIISPLFVDMMNITDPEIRNMAILAVRLFAVGMPLTLINTAMMSYYQSTRSTGMATIICITQSLVYTVVLAVLLVKPLGHMGAWVAFLGAEVFTILTILVATILRNKRFPTKLEDFLKLSDDLGADSTNKLELSIGNSMEEVMKISEGINKFGKGRNISEKLLMELSLCIEEIGGNVIRHAFKPGAKQWFDMLILDKEDSLVVRVRDNGAPFDPTKYWEEEQNDELRYGILMIQGMASRMEYRRTIGLNNLIIVLDKE